ncbi:MAG: SulP family inorganic anion transporter [Clostridiales bacterium]|nr:SulP family inorganic anion transporter [Clostridiales bacterium]
MVGKYIRDLRAEFSGYGMGRLARDLMAGLTVASVALPLALAFGVSSGADAAAGLVTAIAAGLLIGALSGASYQISGPTGAMSAILIGVGARQGIQGVLLAGLLSGGLLIAMSIFNVGGLVKFIPSPVIAGFTSGIALVIALGQVDNFFGVSSEGAELVERLGSYARLGFSPSGQAALMGGAAIAIMALWPKKWPVPGSLVAIAATLVLNLILNPSAPALREVGGIPRSLVAPNRLALSGLSLGGALQAVGPAVSIAALGMIESLLCGLSAGRMKGEPMDARRELMAQGVGNLLLPLIGGVPATAAIARTSVAVRAGQQTRLTGVVHSLALIASMFLLGGVMSRIPLAALAGVLMTTAWRMNEWPAIRQIFSSRMKHAMAMYLITLCCTVLFDLTIAIAAGVLVAAVAHVAKSARLTLSAEDAGDRRVIRLHGALFFGTQGQIQRLEALAEGAEAVAIDLSGAHSADLSALGALREACEQLASRGASVSIEGARPELAGEMRRAGLAD